MKKRYDVRPFSAADVDPAAHLLAERHARQRRAWPALNPLYEQVERARALGVHRSDETWGPNVWVEDAGSAGSDPEALREAYALAARHWHAEGRTSH